MAQKRTKKEIEREEEPYIAPVFLKCNDQTAVWALRTMLLMDRSRNAPQLFTDDDVLNAAGIEEISAYPGGHNTSRSHVTRSLKALERRAKKIVSRGADRSDVVFDNVNTVGKLLDLNEFEEEVLSFVVLANAHSGLCECAEPLAQAEEGGLSP